MKPKMMNQPTQINADAADTDGVYSNVFFVAASRAEFVLDFARVVPGVKGAKLKSRVIVSPHRMKALIQTLQTQVDTYENKFGKLEGEGQAAFGFQTKNPEGEEPEE